MSNLSVFDFQGQAVRSTGDGRFSVYDVLVAFGCYPNTDTSRITFKRMIIEHSEVRSFCSDFKFPGRGQRETPVAAEEGMYQILMLCPGKRGAEFRAWAAKLVKERIEEEQSGDLAYSRGRDLCVHSNFEGCEGPFYYVEDHVSPAVFLAELAAYLNANPDIEFSLPNEDKILNCYLREADEMLLLSGIDKPFGRLSFLNPIVIFKATIIRDW